VRTVLIKRNLIKTELNKNIKKINLMVDDGDSRFVFWAIQELVEILKKAI
jgi:hypothetical protein